MTRTLRWTFAAALALLAMAPQSARAQTLELRGTLLCNPEGRRDQQRPVSEQILVVRPRGLPGAAELTSREGLFRVRVPMSFVDGPILLEVLSGYETIDHISTYLEPGRLQRSSSGRYLYVVHPHELKQSCEVLSTDASLAAEVLNSMRATAEPVVSESNPWWKRALLAPVAGLGMVLGLGGSSGGGPPTGGTPISAQTLALTNVGSLELDPGALHGYARSAGSTSVGRTLTSRRSVRTVAAWNPSALALTPLSEVSADGSTLPSYQAGASFSGLQAPLRIAALSLSVIVGPDEWRGWARTESGVRVEEDFSGQEVIGLAGVGIRLRENVSAGFTYQIYHQELATPDSLKVITVELEDGATRETTSFATRETERLTSDLHLSFTWDPMSSLRVAGAVLNVLGTESLTFDGGRRPLREGSLGALFQRKRWTVGAELSVDEEELDLAVGSNLRVARFLALDAGASTRFSLLQGGVDLFWGGGMLSLRVQDDDAVDTTGRASVSYRW